MCMETVTKGWEEELCGLVDKGGERTGAGEFDRRYQVLLYSN